LRELDIDLIMPFYRCEKGHVYLIDLSQSFGFFKLLLNERYSAISIVHLCTFLTFTHVIFLALYQFYDIIRIILVILLYIDLRMAMIDCIIESLVLLLIRTQVLNVLLVIFKTVPFVFTLSLGAPFIRVKQVSKRFSLTPSLCIILRLRHLSRSR